ncbi:MAG: YraN family protein [Parvibaculum sp.]|nr:YraN family protein [Parvibaculum sp.]
MSNKRPVNQLRETRGRKSYEAGLRAENLATLFMMLKFYRILGRRVKTRSGEIDLIARRGRMLVFVEVKASAGFDRAIEALGPHQRDRLARAASLYVASRPALQHLDIRFDMVLVARGYLPRHVVDAWRP